MNDQSNKSVLNEHILLSFFNLTEDKIDFIDIYRKDGTFNVNIGLIKQDLPCPSCSNEKNKIKDYKIKKIKHQVFHNEECILHYKARRFKCPICNKTFYERNPFSFTNSKLTLRTVYNILNDLKSPKETFTSIANKYFISPTTVSDIFDRHVSLSRIKLPEVLLIDEVYISKGTYACVMIDFHTLDVVDILPSRQKNDLINYFLTIPINERKQVKYLVTDLWESYRQVAKSMLPSASVVADKFHVIQVLTRKVSDARVRIMKEIKNRLDLLKIQENISLGQNQKLSAHDRNKLNELEKEYYLLKKFNWLLFKGNVPDPNQPKRLNRKYNRYLNLYDIYYLLLDIDDEIEEP